MENSKVFIFIGTPKNMRMLAASLWLTSAVNTC